MLENPDSLVEGVQLRGAGLFLELTSEPVAALLATALQRISPLIGQLYQLFSGVQRIRRTGNLMLEFELRHHQAHALMFDVTLRGHRADAAWTKTVEQSQRLCLRRGGRVGCAAHLANQVADDASECFGDMIGIWRNDVRVE